MPKKRKRDQESDLITENEQLKKKLEYRELLFSFLPHPQQLACVKAFDEARKRQESVDCAKILSEDLNSPTEKKQTTKYTP